MTIHGREQVMVVSVDEFRRLKGEPSGAALIEALQASPDRDVDLEPQRAAMPVRELKGASARLW